VIKGAREESASGGQIPLLGNHDVNDLTELVNRSVQIDPPTADLDVRFVDTPTIAWGVPAGSGRINQQWGEPVHPAINRDVIVLDLLFGQQLFDVTVRKPTAQVPPHSHGDHIRREPEPDKAGPRR